MSNQNSSQTVNIRSFAFHKLQVKGSRLHSDCDRPACRLYPYRADLESNSGSKIDWQL